MEPTIKDVARLAGVSVKTVSRVLNDSENVRPETVQRVQAAVQQLGYSPNPLARSLRSGHKMAIGVLIAHDAEVVFANPFFSQVLRGIAHSANQSGFRLVLTYAPESSQGPGAVERSVDGLVVMSIGPRNPLLNLLHSRGIPFVLTCHHDTGLDIPLVETDNEQGAFLAVDHLIRLGHRRIAFIGGSPELLATQERHAGYRRALSQAGIAPEPSLEIFGEYREEAGLLWASNLLRQSPAPTAIFAAGDVLAIGAYEAARRQGLRIPEDLSVVGFDDVPFARYFQPPLTSVSQDGYRKGVIAGEMLIRLVLGRPVNPRQVVLEPELMIRQSTAQPSEEHP